MSQRPEDAPVYDLEECRLASVDGRMFEFRRAVITCEDQSMDAHWPSQMQIAALSNRAGESQIVIAADETRDSLITKFGAIPDVILVGINETAVQLYRRTELETSSADYDGAAIQDEAAMLEIAIRFWTGERRSRQWAEELCRVDIMWRDVVTNEIISSNTDRERTDWQRKTLFASATW
jgi:hypothetical protein